MIEGILIEGFIYGLVTLGVLLTYRIVNICDMTCDGTFPLGAAVAAVLLQRGLGTPGVLIVVALAGAGAGLVTAILHTRLKLPDLLAGILTMTMLRSVNLRVMGNRANLSLLKTDTIFKHLNAWGREFAGGGQLGVLIFCFCAAVVIMILIDIFCRTDFGLALGALGSNPQLIISIGMNPDSLKVVGIAVSNAIIAIAGAFAAMYQGFADIGFGQGMIVGALASLMMGEFLVRSNRITILTLRALAGSILYRALMYLARTNGYRVGMTANDLNLITGILIIICVIISRSGFRKGYGKSWDWIKIWRRARGKLFGITQNDNSAQGTLK
jgi:putative ABC transport system permease protein